mmetsp:Transcript_2095/g.2664  ORF Transcript_2095/g.2664 Transcript_2095/m.2664 type:complete len:236 (-) Transcript_2095:810-1517(-)
MQHSHKKRNAKTSMLFTIALAYLVFGGSSLLLMGNMIVGFLKNFLGSDIFVSSVLSTNDLPEADLRVLLNKEMTGSRKKIENYAFIGTALHMFLRDIYPKRLSTRLSSGGSFPNAYVRLYPIDRTFIDSSLIEFYQPKLGQPGVSFEKTRGKEDFIKSLYSNDGTVDFGGNSDKYKVASKNFTSNVSKRSYESDFTQQIKIVIPEGIKDVLSISGGDTIKLTLNSRDDDVEEIYR